MRALTMPFRLRIRARFVLVLSLLVTGTAALGAVALAGLGAMHDHNVTLRAAIDQSTLDDRILRADIITFGRHLELYVAASHPTLQRHASARIDPTIAEIERGLATVRRQGAGTAQGGTLSEHERLYDRLFAIWRRERLQASVSIAERRRLVERIRREIDRIIAAGERVEARDERRTMAAAAAADSSYRSARTVIVGALIAVLVGGVLLAGWLERSIVPRARRYARFAGRAAGGDLDARLDPRGDDELDELGRSLDEFVATRQEAEEYADSQTRFTDALQVSDSEEEAHLVLRAHLERSLHDSEVVVLNRNNSADRLEARTPVEPGSPLADGLDGAQPRDCLAVRLARPYWQFQDGQAALMACRVCGSSPGAAACRPLLVGGEVTGSVLVRTPVPIDAAGDRRLQDTVVQAAPVLANLRNLAVAELRAATDSLTGLPNSRSVRDTVKRMAAQAGRTKSPLAAALLDLDHFKQVNDTYGHGRGDDVLAAVGTVLSAGLRESDFVGRMGGEEFVMLLPDTGCDGAVAAAEKIRAAVAALTVPGVDRDITISIGIAVIPEHAGDAEGVLRAADRALYAAKEHGRNRVEVAVASEAAAARRTGTNPRDAT